jgi:hypothetical protein
VRNLPPSLYYGFDEQYVPFPIADVLDWGRWHNANMERMWIGREEWQDYQGRKITVSTRFFGTIECLWESIIFVDDIPQDEFAKRRDDYGAACLSHAYNLTVAQGLYPTVKR